MTNKAIKEWFEANYLDGDKVQKGQMLSSEESLNVALEAYRLGQQDMRGRALEKIKKISHAGISDGRDWLFEKEVVDALSNLEVKNKNDE